MTASLPCIYDLAWRGPCGKPSKDGYCPEHAKEFCRCGKKATRQCDWASSLVCGYPMCDDDACKRFLFDLLCNP